MAGRRDIIAMALSLMVLGVAAVPQKAASAETLSHHGTYSDWQVFRLVRDTVTACYAATQARQFFPRGATRSQPTLYVVRYPKMTAKNTVEFRFGQDISMYQSITAKIVARRKQARDSLALATKSTTGFIAQATNQASFIKAMRKGREIVVVSQPGVIDILEDRYSLYGVTKALAKLEALCPGPQPVAAPALKGAISDSVPAANPRNPAKPAAQSVPAKDAAK